MKISSPYSNIESNILLSDYENAKQFDKLRVGKKGIYFPSGFSTKFIPYDYIENTFIRIHEVNGKLCCGSTKFQYFRIVFVHDGKEFADYISEQEGLMDEALKEISKNAPTIKVGFNGGKNNEQ